MSMKINNWSDVSVESISLESIRNIYVPVSNYRFSPTKYDPGAKFPVVIGLPMTLYVLKGSCKYICDGDEITLNGGDIFLFDKGSYQMEVIGDERVELVSVFEIPKFIDK